jgi:type VI secretion system secreted protein VgrG
LNVHTACPREGVTGSVVDVSSSTAAWVYAHEFGHCVGLPDEYSYSTDVESVKYYKPDGTLDAAISAPPDGKAATDPDATIMAAYGSLTKLPRHAWNIAIETQSLLTEKLGRAIKCKIV